MSTLNYMLAKIKGLKAQQDSQNQDYVTGYMSALSTVEGIICEMETVKKRGRRMSREILFTAKRKNWKELPKEQWWVEGYYRSIPCMGMLGHYILPQNTKNRLEQDEIDVTTLCQYTGLKDKNGWRIWENDILDIPDEDGYFECKWKEDAARFVLNGRWITVDLDNYWSSQAEVMGNVFDDAYLLEVE